MPHIYIILVTYNRARFLEQCLASFHETVGDADYTLVIWDNASTDDTRPLIETYAHKNSRIRPVFHEKNIYQSAFGRAFEAVPPPPETAYVLELDDDIISFPPGWLAALTRAFTAVPYLGYLAADVVQDTSTKGAKAEPEFYQEKDYGNGVVIQYGPTGGWCTMTPYSLYKKVGGFISHEVPHFFLEDADYRKKISREGYLFGILKGVCVYHATGEAAHRTAGYGSWYEEKYKNNPKLESLHYRKQQGPERSGTPPQLDGNLQAAMRSFDEYVMLYEENAQHIAALISNGLHEEPMLFFPSLVSTGMYVVNTMQRYLALYRRLKRISAGDAMRVQEASQRLIECFKRITDANAITGLNDLQRAIQHDLIPAVRSFRTAISGLA